MNLLQSETDEKFDSLACLDASLSESSSIQCKSPDIYFPECETGQLIDISENLVRDNLLVYPAKKQTLQTDGKRCKIWETIQKEEEDMPRYKVTMTEEEREELQSMIQKGGKGYRIKHAQILLKLNESLQIKSQAQN